MIVEKFWPTVPESRFVLVAFENELRAASETVALAKILGHTAHEKIRPLRGGLENPREHCCSRRFSMCPADYNRMFPRQKHFLQHFRQRAIQNLAVQHLFQFRISACNH